MSDICGVCRGQKGWHNGVTGGWIVCQACEGRGDWSLPAPAAQPAEVSRLPTPIQDPNDDLAWLVNGIRAQANDYLTKPTGAERLVALTTLRAHALVLREDFQDNGWPVVATETAPAEVSERLNGEIKRMVDRFLTWKLPENFNPDGGVSFKRLANEGTPYEHKNQPTGTNLFDATQAEEMLCHLLDGSPLLAELAALREKVKRIAALKDKWLSRAERNEKGLRLEWSDCYTKCAKDVLAALSASGGGTKETTASRDLQQPNPLAYTGIKWVDRDGSEHVWPCESHHGMTIYPAGSELKVETGSDNKVQVTEFTEEPRS